MSNLFFPVSRDAAAALVTMKPSTFSMWFKRKVGMPFSRWVHEVRVAQAVELLFDSQCTLDSVAYRVGYSDISTFRRNFKIVTGMVPGHFRRAVSDARAVTPFDTNPTLDQLPFLLTKCNAPIDPSRYLS